MFNLKIIFFQITMILFGSGSSEPKIKEIDCELYYRKIKNYLIISQNLSFL